ncbi:MAG: SCO family protein [Bacteroidota bacterium]
MRRTRILAFLVTLTAGAAFAFGAEDSRSLPAYQSADLTPEWIAPAEARHAVGSFHLSDQTGADVTEADLDGRVTVVSFFFARCTSICPSLRSNLSDVQTAFHTDDRVQILSHTVMPETDSVDALGAYAGANGVDATRWRLLTGDRDVIYRLARESYFADVAEGGFLHTETFYLLDGQRRIRGVYNGTLAIEVAQLVSDAEALLAEMR